MAYCSGCGSVTNEDDAGWHVCAPGSSPQPLVGQCTRCGQPVAEDAIGVHQCDPAKVPNVGQEIRANGARVSV